MVANEITLQKLPAINCVAHDEGLQVKKKLNQACPLFSKDSSTVDVCAELISHYRKTAKALVG